MEFKHAYFWKAVGWLVGKGRFESLAKVSNTFCLAPALGCTALSLNARLCGLQQEPGALLAPVFGLQFWRRVHCILSLLLIFCRLRCSGCSVGPPQDFSSLAEDDLQRSELSWPSQELSFSFGFV